MELPRVPPPVTPLNPVRPVVRREQDQDQQPDARERPDKKRPPPSPPGESHIDEYA
ncbi:MAG TPA: hypothetical protein VJU83_03215 [Burkholderiales bacterium]|nr:hypothetical protein [Burkholderiales bacterium]